MPKMMKKLLHTETPTVSMSIFNVACLPVMVKKRKITTTKPTEYDKSFWKKNNVNWMSERRLPIALLVDFILSACTFLRNRSTDDAKYLCEYR